ncbi:MAG: metallophosphoesterase family protein [Dehalococcoidia bacterium]|nr:metallophosphoesterase family protein [Dehalococcoidia bacterium]
MKLGIVADMHGNVDGLRIALERMGPVDELVCAGDAVYQFRFSNEVMALLRERGARYVLGNHERVLLGPAGAGARSAAGIRRELLDYMAAQPYHLETQVNGRKLVVVHGSPFDPHDEYLYPNSPNLKKLAWIEADFVILGHTHYHMATQVGRTLVVNPGSAGEPRDHRNGFRLSCAVLDTQSGDVTFHHYDDPTRPKVDPAIVPQPRRGAQQDYHRPQNVAWWD